MLELADHTRLERFPPKLLDFGDKEAPPIYMFSSLLPVLVESNDSTKTGKAL